MKSQMTGLRVVTGGIGGDSIFRLTGCQYQLSPAFNANKEKENIGMALMVSIGEAFLLSKV